MDSFDDFINDYLITKSKILREIDEETAYIYYLSEAYQLPEFDLELRKPYHSPIRTTNLDEKPSFSVFENTRQSAKYDYHVKYLWKDSGNNTSGDLFALVHRIYDLSNDDEVFQKIGLDFGLDFYNQFSNTIREYVPISTRGKIIPKAPSYIRIKSKPFTTEAIGYWRKYGITRELLAKHEVTQVQYYWTEKDQVNPYTPKSLCFAYKIVDEFGGVYYKLYTPFATEFKFINDYPDYIVEGWDQLDYTKDICIITKSHKDIVVLDSINYTSCSPKSETTMINSEKMNHLLTHFKKIYILFDNDGKHNYEKYKELYPEIPLILIPISSGSKDISDYRASHTKEETKELINSLIKNS